MLLYKPVAEHRHCADCGYYDAYGIVGFSIIDGSCLQKHIVADVTTSYQEVRVLSELCTKEQLELIHLNNVIEDFLVR